MRFAALFAVGLVAGCGMEESEFVDSYAASLCDHTLACSNSATLTFDGIVTHDDCVALKYNSVGEWGAGCRFKAKPAETCLEDMALLTCPPAEGVLAERPISCDFVYIDCPDIETLVDNDEGTEESADTDE